MSEDTTANNGQGFVYGEVELAGVTGIGVKVLQKKRGKKLQQGVDWDLAGLRVAYSAGGLVAILQAVTGKEPENGEIAGVRLTEVQERTHLGPKGEGDGAPGVAALARPNVRTARVTRLFPNPYIIECQLESREESGGTLKNYAVAGCGEGPQPKPGGAGTIVAALPAAGCDGGSLSSLDSRAKGEVVVVRVKTSKNFRRGMEVPLRLDGGSGRYELARRLPRFAGKW